MWFYNLRSFIMLSWKYYTSCWTLFRYWRWRNYYKWLFIQFIFSSVKDKKIFWLLFMILAFWFLFFEMLSSLNFWCLWTFLLVGNIRWSWYKCRLLLVLNFRINIIFWIFLRSRKTNHFYFTFLFVIISSLFILVIWMLS